MTNDEIVAFLFEQRSFEFYVHPDRVELKVWPNGWQDYFHVARPTYRQAVEAAARIVAASKDPT